MFISYILVLCFSRPY